MMVPLLTLPFRLNPRLATTNPAQGLPPGRAGGDPLAPPVESLVSTRRSGATRVGFRGRQK
jgi:hypothetical protein